MNDKGLTLIELLAVFLVIAVLGTITFISVISRIEDVNQKSKKFLIESIELAAEKYILENRYNYDIGDIEISINYLVEEGYLRSENLVNPVTNQNINTEGIVFINIDYNNKINVSYDIEQ